MSPLHNKGIYMGLIKEDDIIVGLFYFEFICFTNYTSPGFSPRHE